MESGSVVYSVSNDIDYFSHKGAKYTKKFQVFLLLRVLSAFVRGKLASKIIQEI
jgi:hypothetical protein